MSGFPSKKIRKTYPKEREVIPVRQGAGVQLSLFDFTPVYRLLCMPMAELHGMTFVRFFGHARPAAVVDIRNHPYFDLVALNRTMAFKIFERSSSRYLHCPLDLRRPADQSARWQLRQNANAVLTSLLGASSSTSEHLYAFLLDDFSEVEILEQAIRSSELDRSFKWQIELLAS